MGDVTGIIVIGMLGEEEWKKKYQKSKNNRIKNIKKRVESILKESETKVQKKQK